MRIWLALPMLVGACLGSALPLHAQTVVGTWQATIENQGKVAKIIKSADGHFQGDFYNLGRELDGTRNGNPLTISVSGRHVRFVFDEEDIAFDGELSADGNTLIGRAVGGSQLITFHRATAKTAWTIDPSPHKVLFVPVEKDVRLEVLDWGGNGPPLILLAGRGNTAHVFDDFAPLFTAKHHVYGITRRGFGLSGRPAPTPKNYDADRMGDDVLAVIDALKLDRPLVAGHSLGGEELSSIGTRHPEKVSGLIYLDAAYAYAFYDPKTVKQHGQTDPPRPAQLKLRDRIVDSIVSGERRYAAVKTPVLAIVASPRACTDNCDTPQYKAAEVDRAAQAAAFQTATPQARVVRIPKSEHYVFMSNEAEVVREMNAFMDGLH